MARFLLGVNYWPRTTAMDMWRAFDAGALDEDFARIADLRLDVVRFFLRWDAFAPTPDRVDPEALEHFTVVLDRLHARGLRAMPTLFCGHMSGANFLPSWALDASEPAGRFRTLTERGESPFGAGDFYGGELLDAQRMLARALGARAREHPALLAWDLGNEFSNVRRPRTASDAAHWSAALTHDLFATSNAPVTGGLHGEDLTEDRVLRPSSMAEPWRYATMHGYPAYSAFARGASDPEVVPFLCELTAAFARKRVLFSEFGNPACRNGSAPSALPCLNEDEMAGYASAVLDRLQRRGALGAFWWCWSDYAPALATRPPFDRAPHELTFGIVRDDGTEKPVAAALAAFAAERRPLAPAPPALIDETTYYRGLPESTARAYAAYVEERRSNEEIA